MKTQQLSMAHYFQSFQQEYNYVRCCLIIMLPSNYCKSQIKWATIFTKAWFSSFQHMKKTDMSKASIQLMLEPNKTKLDLDILKKTNQYNLTQINKLFITNQHQMNLGEAVNLIVDGEMSMIKKQGFQVVFNIVENFMLSEEQDFETLSIHDNQSLLNFLTVFTELQKCTTPKIANVFLTLIALFSQKSAQITSIQRQLLLAFLCKRQYLTKFGLSYLESLSITPDMNLDTEQKVLSTCYRISIVTNVLKAKQHSPSLNANQNLQEKLSMLQKLLMASLSNPDMKEVFSRVDPTTIFIPGLLVKAQFRQKYAQMILSILDPTHFYYLKIHPNFLLQAFNQLILFYGDEPKLVQPIVQRFMLCVKLYFNKFNQINFPENIIMVCDRFGFTTPGLIEMVQEYYSGMVDKYENSFYHKKKILFNRANILRLYYEIGVLYQSASSLPEALVDGYLDRIELFFNPKMNLLYEDVMEYFSQKQVAQLRKTRIQENEEQPFYEKHFQFIKKDLSKISESVSQHQQELGVIKNEAEIQNRTYPINLKANAASRIKYLVWTLYFYAKWNKNPAKAQEVFSIITNNKMILDSIQKYFWYPGIFEGFYLLYLTVEPHIQENNIKSFISLYLKTQSEVFTQIFNKLLNKPYTQSDHLQSIFYSKYIQNISPSLGRNLQAYTNEYNIEMGLYQSAQMLYAKKSVPLRQKVHKELRSYFSRFSRTIPIKVIPFYIEYPFIADFLISVRGKTYAIFVSEEENLGQRKGEAQRLSLKQNSIQYFKNSCTIIRMENQDDIKNISFILDKKR